MRAQPGHAAARSDREQRGSPPLTAPCGHAGFTLIELVFVIAMAAMLFQLVTMNLGAMIPARAMDSEAAQLVSRIDFLRSEARLQGKTYILELDLDAHRFHTLIPIEDRLASSDEAREAFDLGWTALGDNVRFGGCAMAGGTVFSNGLYQLKIDENGFTTDQAIYLRHVSDENLVWTIQLRGLTGSCRTLTNLDGVAQPLEKMEEGRF